MAKVTVTVHTEARTVKSTGAAPGLLRVYVKDVEGNVIHEQDVQGNVAEFSGVVAGEYLITAVRLDANGMMLGDMASQRFSVEVDELMEIESPVGFSVQVEAE